MRQKQIIYFFLMQIKPYFLSQLVFRVNSKQVDVVTPRLSIDGHNVFDHLFVWTLNLWVYCYRLIIRRQASGTAGGAMLIRKSMHDKMGGYNSRLREFDDIDYIHRMWKQNASCAFAWKAIATTSNRRSAKQGRFATFLQSFPSDYFITRHFIRPLMKILNIKPKWHELELK
jgi:hypothetical protein